AYLALSPDRPYRREALAGLLWPEFPERAARNSLRNALANLRHVIRDHDASRPFLRPTHQTIQFNSASDCWLDVAAFEELLTAAPSAEEELERAVGLVRGRFLEGFTLTDAAPFEEWLLLRREQLDRQLVEALDSLAAIYEGRGDYEQALAHARRREELDPWQEGGQRQLIRLLALSGQRNAALVHYEGYRRRLAAELGVEPSQETQATIQFLRDGQLPALPSAAQLVPERERQVVTECPYRGLAPFREEDAPFFFGREGFADSLLHAPHEPPPVVVIVGSSGSGKSSVVSAGLLPRLRDTGEWLIASLRPGGQPFQALAAALIPPLEPQLGEPDRLIETQKLAGALGDGEISLCAVVERTLGRAPGSMDTPSGRALLVIDQFEELYTLCPEPDTRRRFLETLLAAVEAGSTRRQSPLVLLLTLRADFMGQALAHRPFADALQEGALMLGPMTREELHRAIEKPAEKQGAALEEGLVDRLLDDVGEEPGRLPLLEFALTLLWEQLDRGWMTHAAYEQIGRVHGALARYAQEVFEELTADEQQMARRIFLQLVQPGQGTEDTRRVATRAELGDSDASWSLVQQLAGKRLVVTGRNATTGGETVELVHEALIQRWGRLRGWMEADRAFRTWQERLRAALLAWESSGQDEGALLRGAPLVEAESWLDERARELGAAEVAFIQAGMALRERRQREREQRRRTTILALAGGLVVALVLALLAGGQWQRAKEQREEALRQASVGLAAKALAELEGTVPERAVLLALEALEGYPYTPQAETALAQAVEAYTPRLVLRWGPYTWAVAWSPDGGRIAAAAEAGAVIWDADSGGQWCRIRHEEYCNGSAVAWSPDGDRLVVVGEKLAEGVDEACLAPRVWDVSKNEHLLTLTGHDGQATSVAWSPDGATILSAGVDGTARIWDADSGEELLTLAGHAGGVNDAVWSPRGDRVVTAAEDGTATVWEIPTAPALSGVEGPDTTAETGTELLTLSSHTGGLTAAAWSPDGSRIATGGTDGLVHIWQLPDGSTSSGDAVTGEILFTLSAHSKEVRGLAWSPDGERIASSSADGTVRLWDAATGEELVVLHGLLEDLRNVAWSPSGDRLIVGGGTSLPVWDVSRRRLRLSGHTDDVWDAQWSPDGRTIATTSYDGTARTWDALTGQQQLALEHPAGVRFLAWSPDGTRLVTTCQDRFARVWDAASGELLLRVSAPEDHFFFVPSWSPDGSRFAAASVPDNVIRIFDTATGELLSSFGTGDWVHRLSWSPEGDRIVVGNLG
ncbi:MAG: BTAD domain-containing putative transcriptional regulator, partial [Anaerolineae bacterium]